MAGCLTGHLTADFDLGVKKEREKAEVPDNLRHVEDTSAQMCTKIHFIYRTFPIHKEDAKSQTALISFQVSVRLF